MSALGPAFVGKPPPKAPATRPSAHASPGLGEKMRAETGRALEGALGEGRKFATGLEGVVKAAAAAAGPPIARVVPKGSGVRTPVNAPAPPAMTPEGAQVTSLPSQRPLMSAARNLPGQVGALPSRAWSAAKKPLALGALGAAGALAYGMHQQNQQDHENQQLVYAPMQGAMM